MTETYLFVSGKGGVGKSTVTANLAVLLAEAGYRVVLIDADLGLRSQDLFLNLENSIVYDLIDVASGNCLLSQALISVPDLPNLMLLPAAQFARSRSLDSRKLKKILSLLKQENDFILIDCPAGLEKGLRNVLNAGSKSNIVLMITPDDLCIRDGERVISLLEEKKLSRPLLLVNRLQNDLIRTHDMYSARTIADLLDLQLLGEIPEDPAVYVAQLRHKLIMDFDCDARKALIRISKRLQGQDVPFAEYGKKRISLFRYLFGSEVLEVKRRNEQKRKH